MNSRKTVYTNSKNALASWKALARECLPELLGADYGKLRRGSHMLRFHFSWLGCLLMLASAGCCCVQRVGPTGDCGMGACQTANYSSGPLMNLISCRGGCGEVYVDEWLSEPPVADNCGFDCGGCGRCGQCTPIRSALRLLWGRPFVTSCNTGLCGPSCEAGCSSCEGGYADEAYHDGDVYHGGSGHASSGCNCGKSHHSIPYSDESMPMEIQGGELEEVPYTAPKTAPTPAPAITPSSAKRLNPAARRTTGITASTR